MHHLISVVTEHLKFAPIKPPIWFYSIVERRIKQRFKDSITAYSGCPHTEHIKAMYRVICPELSFDLGNEWARTHLTTRGVSKIDICICPALAWLCSTRSFRYSLFIVYHTIAWLLGTQGRLWSGQVDKRSRQKGVFFAISATIVAATAPASRSGRLKQKFELFGDNGNKAGASGGQPEYHSLHMAWHDYRSSIIPPDFR